MIGLEELNESQREAVKVKDGSLIIFAGAGSGKTRVLTHRIAYLIENEVNPYNILAITFTNKAASEMRERVNELAYRGSDVWVSTFHSMCARILRIDIDKLSFDRNFTIYDTDDSTKLLKLCIKEMNLNEKQNPVRTIRNYISGFKDELQTPDDVKNQAEDFKMEIISDIYRLYQKKLKLANALDFDDLIFKTIELFQNNKDVLEKYQEKFKYIMVDEYQDTNHSQYILIKLLAERHNNLCVVGDDDQSIYGWRGADIRNILNFDKDFKDAKIIKLEQNYRSTQNILDTANSVIINNFKRQDKKLWTDKTSGTNTKVFKARDDREEALFVAEKIKSLKNENYSYKDFAILYRTNAQSRVLEDAFVKKNIPYRLYGGVRFYERREIKDLLAYMSIIYNPSNEIAIRRIINVPRRGIGQTTIDRISDYAKINSISFYDALSEMDLIDTIGNRTKQLKIFFQLIQELMEDAKTMSVSKLLEAILKKSTYMENLVTEDPEDTEGRIENIGEFINKTIEFEANVETPDLAHFLEEIALVADIDNYDKVSDSISLMTIHNSKGLEFKCVFVVGVEDGIFPSHRTTMSFDDNELEEERRLFYVAVTRAEDLVFLTHATSRLRHGKIEYNSISRFIKEIPKDLIDDLNRTKVTKKIEKNNNKKNQPFNEFSYLNLTTPKNIKIDFEVGDTVLQSKYGEGIVKDIRPAGADFEVAVEFEEHGTKKFMAMLSKLQKVDN